MAKCSNCGKEVPQTEGKRQKLYCDDACRMKLKRRASHKIKPLITNINTEQTITEQDRQPVRELHKLAAKPTGQTRPELMSMSADNLMVRINRDQDWPASAEYAELIRRLTTWSVDELLEAGYSLPCWLRQEQQASKA